MYFCQRNNRPRLCTLTLLVLGDHLLWVYNKNIVGNNGDFQAKISRKQVIRPWLLPTLGNRTLNWFAVDFVARDLIWAYALLSRVYGPKLNWGHKKSLLNISHYHSMQLPRDQCTIFTVRYYAERGIAIAMAKSSVRPSVRDVEVSWSHWLEFFQNNFTISQLGALAWSLQSPTSRNQGRKSCGGQGGHVSPTFALGGHQLHCPLKVEWRYRSRGACPTILSIRSTIWFKICSTPMYKNRI